MVRVLSKLVLTQTWTIFFTAGQINMFNNQQEILQATLLVRCTWTPAVTNMNASLQFAICNLPVAWQLARHRTTSHVLPFSRVDEKSNY